MDLISVPMTHDQLDVARDTVILSLLDGVPELERALAFGDYAQAEIVTRKLVSAGRTILALGYPTKG